MGFLAGHLGEWRGTNAFRLKPDDPPFEAATEVRVSAAVRGHLTEVGYTWSHPESGEHSGLLVLGSAEDPPGVVAMWSDTFHQSPAAGLLAGTAEDESLTVGCTYAGDWEWKIAIDTSDPARLAIRMDNVVPESAAAAHGFSPGAYWAMKADLVRHSP